jgi:hypothetical protein
MKTILHTIILSIAFTLCNVMQLHAAASFSLLNNDVTALVRHVSSCSSNTASGKIEISITGGVAPWQISLFDGEDAFIETVQNSTGQHDFEDLEPGGYRIEITDASCGSLELYANVEVVEGSPISITGEVAHNCDRRNPVGGIDINVEGGVGPFQVHWIQNLHGPLPIFNLVKSVEDLENFSSGEQNLSGMPAGSYFVFISDNNGCNTIKHFTISFVPLFIDFPDADPICLLGEGGPLLPTVENAEEPLDAVWERNLVFGFLPIHTQNGVTASELMLNTYNIWPIRLTVTDDRGCRASKEFYVEFKDFPIENSHIHISASASAICDPNRRSLQLRCHVSS